MTTIQQFVGWLMEALRQPLRRKELVKNFQNAVWQGLDPSIAKPVADILRELAYDLDLFEPNPTARAEDGALYGQVRFEEEVRAGLQRLKDAGVQTEADL